MAINSRGVLSNLIWKFAERISAQVVTLIVSLVLARILEPSHYGTIAIVTIFISIANVFVSDSFGTALIQKKDADILDFSSVLYFNIAFSIALYMLLFFLAPVIARFYGEGYEILTPVIRVLGFRLILSGINSVQQAYVSRKMIFRKFFWATLFGTVISGIVGIVMAYHGFGVWALVAQYLTNTTVDTVVLQITLRKWPKRVFSFKRLRSLVGFGSKVLFTSLIITVYQELRALIIGKLYSSKDLAYYEKGKQFPGLIAININTSIGAVLFPKMSQQQDDIEKVKQTTRTSIRFSSYIMSPIMLGLMSVAEPFIIVLLTDKWIPCISLLKLFCIFYLFQPIQTANTQATKALGRSDIVLKLEIFRDVIQLVVTLIVMWISVKAIVISMAIMSAAFVFVNAYPNIKLINYSLKEQIADILPNVMLSCIMAVAVFFIGKLHLNLILLLIIQIICGMAIYISLSVFTKNREFKYLINIVKDMKKR